jgi:hypothetical protein
MTAIDRYFQSATATLAEVAATQGEALEAAARLVADSVAGGGVLHLFGAGHSQLVALDAYLRAGGLACVNPIVDPALAPTAGLDVARVERTPGHAATVLEGEDLREQTLGFLGDVVSAIVAEYCPDGVYPEEWDLDGLFTALATIYHTEVRREDLDLEAIDHAEFEAMMLEDAERAYKARETELGPELLGELERNVLLTILDRRWREHLYEMDYLQEGIGLRAIGQRDPLVEYQREGFDMFQAMQENIKAEAVAYVFNASVQLVEQGGGEPEAAPPQQTRLSSASTEQEARAAQGQARSGKKVGRNQPCWCGSGKKFKNCHGAPAART